MCWNVLCAVKRDAPTSTLFGLYVKQKSRFNF